MVLKTAVPKNKTQLTIFHMQYKDLERSVTSLCTHPKMAVQIFLGLLFLLYGNHLCSSMDVVSLEPYKISAFPEMNGTLNHFTMAEDGSVYIAGEDVLYHVSQELDMMNLISTNGSEIPNINKILGIVPQPNNKLITCGSGLGQTCQLRNLTSLVSEGELSSLLVAPSDETTVGLVVEHTETAGTGVEVALYVAQSVTREERDKRRPVSVKCLVPEGGKDRQTSPRKETGPPAEFIVRYAAVFSYSGYTYFLASQIGDTASGTAYTIVPKLSRVCHSETDEDLSGFTEIALQCRGNDDTIYSVARAAQVVDGKLYAVFVKNDPDTGGSLNEFRPSNQSALCVYDMEELVAEFYVSITNCTCEDNVQYRSNNNWLGGAGCRPGEEESTAFGNPSTLPSSVIFPPPSSKDVSSRGSGFPYKNSTFGMIITAHISPPFIQSPPACSAQVRDALPCTIAAPKFFGRYPDQKSSAGPSSGDIVFEHPEGAFSSILHAFVDSPTTHIFFIGGREGYLYKVRMEGDGSGRLYETVDLSHPVLSDAHISGDNETIFLLTEKQLLKLSVANCSQFLTCDECIRPGTGRGDPYCGWCTLENRCTRYHECNDSNITDRWLYYDEDVCVQINTTEPASLPVDTDPKQLVEVIVHNLPNPVGRGFNYSCHFGDFTSPADVGPDSNSTLVCVSPSGDDIPEIPQGESSVAVDLSISSSIFNGTFITTKYDFFNCSRIGGCTDCVSAEWGCEWCVDSLLCHFSGNQSCDNIISQDSDRCPQVLPTGTIDIPAGIGRNITVNVSNLQTDDEYERNYQCVLEVADGDTFESDATKLNTSAPGQFAVECNKQSYRYSEYTREKKATLTVRWKGINHTLIDGFVNVTLYKCGIDRPDCSRCLSPGTTRQELRCRWCTSLTAGACVYESECSPTGIQPKCSDSPVITSVFPSNGPIEGGTEVEIYGTDLGQSFEEIDNITLAGIKCDHRNHSDSYLVGASVTCTAGNVINATSGLVLVTVGGNESDSEEMFFYNDPSIESFTPKLGPKSGGTVLNIAGTHLQTGRNITVMLGNRTCPIGAISPDVISCTTEATSDNASSLLIFFDGHNRTAKELFTHLPDPEVTDVQPRRAILSGGNTLTVRGDWLDTVADPQIVFTHGEQTRSEKCRVVSREELICRSPGLEPILRNRRADKKDDGVVGPVRVGFIMDGVTRLRSWSDDRGETFEIVKDPKYEKFSGGVMNHDTTAKGGRLELQGSSLHFDGQRDEDVMVYIGNETCTSLVLNATALSCTPPENPPAAGDVDGNRTDRGLPYVIVLHANLKFELGYLKYSSIYELIMLVALPVFALLVFIILCSLCSVWHMRRQKAAKIHDLELQVMEIQDSVSGNLKSLFATLQTTAEDFDVALGQMRNIPLLSRQQYILNMLFLGFDAKPSPEPTEEVVRNPKIKAAMTKFSTDLLSKKDFLEVLIRTLDQTSTIGSMEKINIASLLSVCLLLDGKQELLTTVMIKLMREQIEDSDGKAQKCRILFSRTETVLEKLVSNWVTVFQYQYLKDHAAMPLHHLFHAIKYVCEMGPVDAVTGKSQFSINDQQMLETQIEFNQLSLSVIVNSVTGEKATISAIDVNTVTQVKQRIISFLYKDSPFSEQPDPYMYDLMWRTGRGGQLILRDDDDLPGNTENEWRKLNTLGDFNVTTGIACFELVEKQENPNASLNVHKLSADQPDGDTVAGTIAKDRRRKYQAVSRNPSFRAGSIPVGLRPWHLVKELDHDDDEAKPNKHKEIKEVVLPFLPATRNYIQKYVDRFFGAVFADESDDISLAVKYLFQIFDREADKLEKPEYAKAWKDNVFTLRYWTTILANPQYALDLGIHSYTSASLRILVQVVKDICAGRSKPIKTDFSPSRLLYSSAMPGYISKLGNFYLHVRDQGRITSDDMARECGKLEQDFEGVFDSVSTQYELYKILQDHQVILGRALDEDDACEEADMAGKLQEIRKEISG